MTLTVFPDPILAALEVLRAEAPAREPGVTFGTKPLGADGPDRPYAAVRLDGSRPGVARADKTAAIRVSVWHTSDAKALALAELLLAILAAHGGNSKVRSFRERTGPIPTEDPETGAPLAFFTVAVRLRPTPLE